MTAERIEPFVLSDEEKADIDEEMSHYEDPGAASVEALMAVQQRRGWVSDEALRAVSQYTGIPASQLEGVATFYNLVFRQPVGRHVIFVCDSVSCWLCGYDSLVDSLRARLGIGFGQTTDDGRFTLLPSVCLGNCNCAPAMMIDDDHHGPVGAEELDRVLEGYS